MSRTRAIVTLREAGREAVRETGAIMQAAFDPAFGEAWTEGQLLGQLIGPATRLTLAHVERSAVGFSLVRTVVDEAELLLIATHPAARGRGVGGALLDAAIDDAARDGATAIFLEVRRGNPAERLYAARGFHCVGERPAYYRGANGQLSDARTFRRQLS